MEVEVKLRLPTADAHAKVAEILKPQHQVTHFQENVFFDGADNELSSRRVILRLRFYNEDAKCVVTLKGKSVMADGIGRSTEEEEEIDPAVGRACVSEPNKLAAIGSSLLNQVVERYGCKEFVCLNGFRNMRMVHRWNDHFIELDETEFPFGTQYEIECESTEPERLRAELESFLASHGIPYSYSTSTKFAIFRAGNLPEYDSMT